jgi:type VI secretion system protein ImpA
MLDIDKLLIDHHGDTACGDDYEYDPLLVEIRQAMEGKPEQKIDDNNIIEAEEPDWRLVKKNSLILCNKTHNLEVLISLTQALTHLQGYSGLAEGSAHLASIIEHYWECIHPQLDPDDDDAIERLNLFMVFNHHLFLLTVQKLELIRSKQMGAVTLYDIRKSKENQDKESANTAKLIHAIFNESEQKDLKTIVDYLAQCSANFKKITAFLRAIEMIGNVDAPAFSALLALIVEAQKIVGDYIIADTQPDPDPVSKPIESDGTMITKAEVKIEARQGIHNRADVIAALEEIEDYFTQYEPGSPIPLLLHRAKNLVDKDFIALLEDLAPDSLNQVGLVLGTNKT